MKIICFDAKDVIATSTGTGGPTGPSEGGNNDTEILSLLNNLF